MIHHPSISCGLRLLSFVLPYFTQNLSQVMNFKEKIHHQILSSVANYSYVNLNREEILVINQFAAQLRNQFSKILFKLIALYGSQIVFFFIGLSKINDSFVAGTN